VGASPTSGGWDMMRGLVRMVWRLNEGVVERRWAVRSECGARGAPPPAVNGKAVEKLTGGLGDGVWAPSPTSGGENTDYNEQYRPAGTREEILGVLIYSRYFAKTDALSAPSNTRHSPEGIARSFKVS